MKRTLLTWALLATLLLPWAANAAFEDLPGLRTASLGGAMVADGGDAMGFFINPASVAWGRASAIEMYSSKLYWGLEGDDLVRTALGGFTSLYDWGAFGLGHDRFDGQLYSEHQTLLTYARLLRPNLSVGVGARLFGRGYEETPYTAVDPLFQQYGYTTSSIGIDLGVQWRMSETLSFGLAARRINRPNQALEDGAEDPLPRELQVGAAWKYGMFTFFGDLEYRDVDVNGVDATPRLGVETNLLERKLFLRAGGNRDEIDFGFGLNFYRKQSSSNYTLPRADGTSERIREFRDLKMRVAYTLRYPIGGISNTFGTHMLGMRIYFERNRDRQGPSQALNIPTPSPPRERIKTVVDTVYVPKVEFVEVEIVDSVKIKAYELEILGLQKEISSLENLNKALGFLEEALRLYYQKLYAQAIARCDSAIREVPSLSLAYIRKASILFAQQKYVESRQVYLKALDRDPDNLEVKEQLQRIDRILAERGR